MPTGEVGLQKEKRRLSRASRDYGRTLLKRNRTSKKISDERIAEVAKTGEGGKQVGVRDPLERDAKSARLTATGTARGA